MDEEDARRSTPAARAFDGERAMDHVRHLVEIGPRPSGSQGIEATRRYVEEVLGGYGLEVERHPFDADTPEGAVEMVNLVVRVPPREGGRALPTVVFAGHYDTKRFEAFRFVGANDAGSSTAILLELGRVLAEHPPPLPVRLVFFDGEEAVVRWTPEDSKYGSRHMVERLTRSGELDEIGALILFDMVGDADLTIDRDLYSTGWLVDLIWSTAEEVGQGEHFGSGVRAIDDDHVPFVEAGVPGVDLIDFSYGPGNRYWHSPFDTVDRLAADSFQAVGEVALSSLPELARRFGSAR